MNGLTALQRDFYAYLRGAAIEPLLARVAERGPAPPAVRLGIYANAYGQRLAEALESDHPILGRYLGDVLWQRMCTGYIAVYPSRFRSLRNFGDALPRFLATEPTFSEQPILAELAAFERALLDAFDAAEGPRLPWSALLAQPQPAWPGLRLRFHPSVRRLATGWSPVAVWQALKAEREPPAAMPVPDGAWLLWRDEQRLTRFRTLAADENGLVTAVLDEAADVAGLCERLAISHPPEQVPVRLLELLQSWFDAGLVGALEGRQPPGG